jgi:type I restriction enzyme R subunit
MPVNEFLEDLVSHLPAVQLLTEMGYEYVTPNEALELRGNRFGRVVLEDVLARQLPKFNQIEFRGKKRAFSNRNIELAIDAITHVPFDGLIKTNEQIYDLLTLGKALEQTIEGNKRSYTLHYIDWGNPKNNVYHVSDEFTVARSNSQKTRRPDIVLFVNGIPLVVIECKSPSVKDAIYEGIKDHRFKWRKNEIPHLYVFAQLVLSLCQNDAKYGTAGTPRKFWSLWREENSQNLDKQLFQLVNRKPSKALLEKLTERHQKQVVERINDLANSGERSPSPQDKTLFALLRPERLLELCFRYIVFDKNIKKIARHQQYFAIRETMTRVTKARGDAKRPGGVIWHTTGSGKSLTMVLLAKAVALETSIKNPRVVIVTDRIDLDSQIWKTFRNCGKTAERARTGEHLVRLVKNREADIITTIIDKFESASAKEEVQDPSRDIFVLVDESHRSQYGLAHAKMKTVFPNACYIGFTGTPLFKSAKKNTLKKFGDFIHKYSMQNAVRDKAVTPLLYEGRMSEIRGDKKAIDKWFDRITVGLTKEQKADLKSKFSRQEELHKTSDRLYEIALDIATHFCENFKGSKLKGQFAVASKAMALRYHKLFQEIGEQFPDRQVATRIIISPPNKPEEDEDTSEDDEIETGKNLEGLNNYWNEMMERYGSEKKFLDRTIHEFENYAEPEILIVVSKLLTGFDAPCNSVLYIDRRLKEHNVLQAIARVNRLFEGKDFGLIVDYRGIFGEMNDALKTYAMLESFDAEDIEGTFANVEDEVAKLKERHTNVVAVFRGVKNRSDIEQMQEHLRPEDMRQEFYDCLRSFSKTLQIALSSSRFHEDTPKKTIERYMRDLKYYRNLRVAVKQRFNETIDYKEYEDQIRNMVNKYIGADEVKQVTEPVNIFEVDLEEELEKIEGDAAKADFIASRIKKIATEKLEEDPVLYKRLSELIEEAIADYVADRMSDKEYLEKVMAAWNELQGKSKSDVPDEILNDQNAAAYYRILKEELANYQVQESKEPYVSPDGDNLRSDAAAEGALKIVEIIDRHSIRDWTKSKDIENAMANDIDDYLFSLKGRYDFAIPTTEIDKLLNRIISTAKRRENHG